MYEIIISFGAGFYKAESLLLLLSRIPPLSVYVLESERIKECEGSYIFYSVIFG